MNHPPMTCDEARETLWPVRQPKLLAGRMEEASNHVGTCAACRAYMADTQALGNAYDQLASTRAPAALRERVFAAIALERVGGMTPAPVRVRPGWRSSVGKAAAAATVVLVVGSVLSQIVPFGPSDSGAVFVDDYLRRAVGQERIETSDPGTVGRWLARELGLPIRPLQFAGLELEGAEICLLDGRRGAMIQYSMNGAQVSHYLVPRRSARERAPSIGVESRDPRGPMPPLVTWSTPALEQALVGDLDSEQLLALARTAY